MVKSFTRTIEDFTCGHCGKEVKGDGYTNHCPKCLWSKHVDVNPGDRREVCGGLMNPISVEKRGEEYFVNQKCEKCGFVKTNRIGEKDNFDSAIAISNSNV